MKEWVMRRNADVDFQAAECSEQTLKGASTMKRYCQSLLMILVALVGVALIASPALAASPNAGATLQADKTLEICLLNDGSGNWKYSGVVAVWNTGTNDATGCQIYDVIENKVGNQPFTTQYIALNNASCPNTIPGGTTQQGAFTVSYSVTGAPLNGTIRNNAKVTISNHSGGRTNGPNPKFTYTGSVPPPACEGDCGCALTQGYWKTHPEAWPADELLLVFDGVLDGVQDGTGVPEAMTILNMAGNDPNWGPYIIVAKQYIAYLLNGSKDIDAACTPSSLQPLVDGMATFFGNHTLHTPALCVPGTKGANNPCNAPLADACILDNYNHGLYEEGPTHCGGVEDTEPLLCTPTP
jgi:hypothetical protein